MALGCRRAAADLRGFRTDFSSLAGVCLSRGVCLLLGAVRRLERGTWYSSRSGVFPQSERDPWHRGVLAIPKCLLAGRGRHSSLRMVWRRDRSIGRVDAWIRPVALPRFLMGGLPFPERSGTNLLPVPVGYFAARGGISWDFSFSIEFAFREGRKSSASRTVLVDLAALPFGFRLRCCEAY